jgi:hypothetical protein
MEADTGLWLMPVQYERTARAAGNAQMALRTYFDISQAESYSLLRQSKPLVIISDSEETLSLLTKRKFIHCLQHNIVYYM